MKTVKEIKTQFKQSIRLGTGKALLLLKPHPEINFLQELKQAVLHNFAYEAPI